MLMLSSTPALQRFRTGACRILACFSLGTLRLASPFTLLHVSTSSYRNPVASSDVPTFTTGTDESHVQVKDITRHPC